MWHVQWDRGVNRQQMASLDVHEGEIQRWVERRQIKINEFTPWCFAKEWAKLTSNVASRKDLVLIKNVIPHGHFSWRRTWAIHVPVLGHQRREDSKIDLCWFPDFLCLQHVEWAVCINGHDSTWFIWQVATGTNKAGHKMEWHTKQNIWHLCQWDVHCECCGIRRKYD